MTPVIVIDEPPPPSADVEGLVLDGLNLSGGSPLRVQGFECPPPAKRMEWAQGADIDGALLIRDPLFENREITIRLRVSQQPDMDTALFYIEALSAKLEETERNPEGLPLVWSPAGSTKSLTFYVLSGAIEGLPITLSGDDAGWFIRAPVINLKLICKPFGYGTDQTFTGTSSTAPLLTFLASGVLGDAPAEGRLILTDTASQSRRFAEWGLEQRHYDPSTNLTLNLASGLMVSGFGGTSTTRAGSYSTNVARGSLFGQPLAVCGTTIQAHVGTFRVKARVYSTSQNVSARLAWQDGDGPLRANPYDSPVAANTWTELDFGVIAITPKALGTQKWSGRIEALATATDIGSNLFSASATLDIDYLLLIPAGEGYGKAAAAYAYSPGAWAGRDDFATLTLSAALNGRTALQGGTWATSGATTDFTGSDAATPGNMQVRRGTTSDSGPRFAILGTSTYTDVETDASVMTTGFPASGTVSLGVLARWVDANNHLQGVLQVADAISNNAGTIAINRVIGGTAVPLKTAGFVAALGSFFRLRLVVFASGKATFDMLNDQGAVVATISATDSSLSGGGTLASGKAGILDYNPTVTAFNRYYDDPYVGIPAAEPIVIYSGQQFEFRHDGTQRQDSTGTYWGPAPSYRGSRMLVPPAGDKNRTSRIAVRAKRNDIDAGPDDVLGDPLAATLIVTPRFIVIPV